MRTVLYLVLIVLVLALVGWITFHNDSDRPGINFETQKMKDDTKKAMETGSNLLKEAERKLDRPSTQPTQPDVSPAREPVGATDR